MVKRSKAATERFYRGLLAEQARSGQTVRAFARARGVPAGTLSFWRHQLKKRDAARAEASESQFVPVHVVDAGTVADPVPRGPTRATRARTSYEVVLEKGRVLRLPADFDDARVAALVRAVTSC